MCAAIGAKRIINTVISLQRLRRSQDLFRSRTYPEILSQHSPADRPTCVDEKFRRPPDVVTVFALTFMNEIVAPNRIQI